MNAIDLKFCTQDVQRLIERQGLVGSWSWVFSSNNQAWSQGFFHLLGLDRDFVSPSYGLFVDLIHPEDRIQMATVAQVLQGNVPYHRIVRVIRPDGSECTLSVVMDVRLGVDGRPLAVSGIALDVTNGEAFARLRIDEQRRCENLYLTTYATTFSLELDLLHRFPSAVSEVHGPSLGEINENPFVMIVREEREAFHARAWDAAHRDLHFQGTTHERLANGDVLQFRIMAAPLYDEDGVYLGRRGLKYPVYSAEAPVASDGLRQALEQTIRGHHLSAARALLDWSMTVLARASGLSLSSVKRLEENGERVAGGSRHKAIDALRRAGIRFIALDDGTIAIARERAP